MKYINDIEYYSLNGKLMPIDGFPKEIVRSSGLVYEVLKYDKGEYLYFKEHLQRLQNSLRLIGKQKIDISKIENNAIKLAIANKLTLGNLKIVVDFKSSLQSIYLFFIPHRYPTGKQYKEGVSLKLQYAERSEPNAKVANWDVRGSANKLIDDNEIYETLLVNNKDEITEGSRSNVFFIKENIFYTASKDKILPGVTRQKVIELLNAKKLQLIYKCIKVDELSDYDHCFITGTSPGILAICRIEEINFSTNLDFID
ncbi:MAG: aminotransferase class IV [Bacteroidetes bacterium]|nr:MAG: aminotransferase class IV [Bacteroidota bacterium]